MKTILVTSELTYVPENYNDVLEPVLSDLGSQIAGVILLKINFFATLGTAAYLYFCGCRHISKTLIFNIINAYFGGTKKLLKKYKIPYIIAKSINSPTVFLWINQVNPDIIFNMRSRSIYNDSVLKIPRLGCFNIHHGILPKQKGLFCDLYALSEGKETGFTIHGMTNKVDQGPIYYQEKTNSNKNYIKYLAEISGREAAAIVNFIRQVAALNFLPKAFLYTSPESVITTTPNLKMIRKFQQKGLIL